MENCFYVYGHYISGNDVPFYIGKGKHNRAYENHNRSTEWKLITSQNEMEVKILHENLTESLAFEIEIFLIAKYGRLDLGTGCLINKTNGGDGLAGQIYTDTRREKIKKSARRSFTERMGEEKAEKTLKKISSTRKKLYQSGKLVPYWKGKRRSLQSIERTRLSKLGVPSKRRGMGKTVQQIDEYGNIICTYQSVSAVAKQLSIPKHTIYTSIRRKSKTNGFYFKYS